MNDISTGPDLTKEEHEQLLNLLKKILTGMAHQEIPTADIAVTWHNGNRIDCELNIISLTKDGETTYV